MSETNEFIDKLMNKKDDELDDILSFADGIKTEELPEKKQSADDILSELFGNEKNTANEDTIDKNRSFAKDDAKKSRSKNKRSSDKNASLKNSSAEIPSAKNTAKNTSASKDSEFTRKIITTDLPSNAVPKNLHHVFFDRDSDYISFSSICQNSGEPPVIADKAEKVRSNFETRQINVLTSDEPVSEKNEDTKKTDTPSYRPSIAADTPSIPDETAADDMSDAEKFMAIQSVKHPKIFFVIGISIFLIILLGLVSCAYLGLNAMKKFTQNYQPTQTTTAYFSEENI